jgi:ABC-type spermidine/putrescine transport system permease subunit II
MARVSGRRATWLFIATILALLYLPLVPPLLFSVGGDGALQGLTLRWYAEMWRNPLLVDSIETSVLAALLTGLATPPLAVLAALAVRELRVPRLIMTLVLLPLFIPAVSMGLGMAFFFRTLGVSPSLWTIALVHVAWALPFAFLIVLTVMASFDPIYLEAAYVHGADRWRAFRDIELPLIQPGVTGAAIFSMILSFNETVRTALVQGPLNTVQTYIWSSFLQVGLSPTLYALMSLLIVLTLALVGAMLLQGLRSVRALTTDSGPDSSRGQPVNPRAG